MPVVYGPGNIDVSGAEILLVSSATKQGLANDFRQVVNIQFVGLQLDHLTLDLTEEGTWETIWQTDRDLAMLKATSCGKTNIYVYPLRQFPRFIPRNYIGHLFDALVGRCHRDTSKIPLAGNLYFSKFIWRPSSSILPNDIAKQFGQQQVNVHQHLLALRHCKSPTKQK